MKNLMFAGVMLVMLTAFSIDASAHGHRGWYRPRPVVRVCAPVQVYAPPVAYYGAPAYCPPPQRYCAPAPAYFRRGYCAPHYYRRRYCR